MSSASRVLRSTRSLPFLVLIAGLLTFGALLAGCGTKETAEAPATAEPQAGTETDQEPIFESDFEEGNTDEWTTTQETDEDTDEPES